jgi:L-asparaginase II
MVVAVEVLRGGRVESRHRASVVAVEGGRRLLAVGDVAQPVLPRSALKPLQALALLERGPAERLVLDDRELALACASHSGEPMHTDLVASWLERQGLAEADLACGAHPPMHEPTARLLIETRTPPSPLHNNCSGKHALMLAAARRMGAPIAGYPGPDHAVQRAIAATLAGMAGVALEPPAVDGCGVPNWPLPLEALAAAMARLAAPDGLAPARARAARRITDAMRAHPELVGGSGRACTLIMTALPEVVVKTGAEGVYVALVPGRGLGVALKVEDGAGRAAPVALLVVLEALGLVPDAARGRLEPIARPTLRNHAGTPIGGIRPAAGFPG